MREECKINIEGKECQLEFCVKKYDLTDESKYFADKIKQSPESLTFSFSNQSFDENSYTLDFSEFLSEGFQSYQINSKIDV